MKKTSKLHQNIDKAYALDNARQILPRIKLRIESDMPSESFSCNYADGTIHLKAADDCSGVYGMHRAILGALSNHMQETIGEWKPHFTTRPLWIGSTAYAEIAQGLFAYLPLFLMHAEHIDKRIEKFCSKLLELGYNSVIFGTWDNPKSPSKAHQVNFKSICSYFHEFGVRVYLKIDQPALCVLEDAHAERISEMLECLESSVPNLDGLFWQGTFHLQESVQHPKAENATQYDLAKAEVELLSKTLSQKIKLIYYVSSASHESAKQQVVWLPQLCNDLDNRTRIAFSAVAGDLWCDHRPPHPLWESFQCNRDHMPNPLMPIINIGAVRQGEGLWPCLTFDLMDHYVQRCISSHLDCAIMMTSQLPASGSLLECNLWTAGQMLWRKGSAKMVAETWFAAKRPDLKFQRFAIIMDKIRYLTIDLSYFLSLFPDGKVHVHEELRAKVESFLAELRHLQILFDLEETHAKNSALPLLHDYFAGFVRDANRIVARLMQSFQISIPYIRREDDGGEGFWTEAKPSSALLDIPCRGGVGSRTDQIIQGNYLEF